MKHAVLTILFFLLGMTVLTSQDSRGQYPRDQDSIKLLGIIGLYKNNDGDFLLQHKLVDTSAYKSPIILLDHIARIYVNSFPIVEPQFLLELIRTNLDSNRTYYLKQYRTKDSLDKERLKIKDL